MTKVFGGFSFRFFLCFAFLAASCFAQTAPLLPYGKLPVVTANTATDTATLTTQQMQSQLLTGTPTAAANYTTPTATALCALFPFINASGTSRWSYEWMVKNTSGGANTITMVGGTGVTVVGTATIAQNNIKRFIVNFTSCGASPAVQLISLGTSTF